MASAIQASLQSLQPSSAPADFQSALGEIAKQKDAEAVSTGLRSWFDALLASNVSIVANRPLLDAYANALKTHSSEVRVSAGQHAVDGLRSRVASYEEQDTAIRHILADAYTQEDEFVEAAKTLQGVQLESSQRKISDQDKFDIWVKICRLYLEADDPTTAETFLNRAKNLLYQIDDKQAQLIFKLSQARIFDSSRRFLEAGTTYHEVSTVSLIDEEEREHTLSKAITCAVLAPAGSRRTALLRKLHRDERASGLEEYTMLENMYLGRLIAPEETEKFAAKLETHQLAQTAEGSTVLAKAVTEHNLLGISSLYESINASELGLLLGLEPAKAEEYAARMVEQGRLSAQIDHVDGFIHFRTTTATQSKFDERIRLLLEDVERVASLVNVGAA